MLKRNLKSYLFLWVIAFALGGCGLFKNEQEPEEPTDFGFEEGYFIYHSNGDKIPWTRNRNYLSLEFYEEVSEEKLQDILQEYDLRFEGQVFPIKHVYARVTNKPAEEYYTTYGDSTQPVLGNKPEVRYALPVFMNEFWEPIMITNKITIRFDSLSSEQELHIIDSLIVVDKLTRIEDGPGTPTRYRVLVNKNSPEDPLALIIRYYLIDNIRHASLNFAFRFN